MLEPNLPQAISDYHFKNNDLVNPSQSELFRIIPGAEYRVSLFESVKQPHDGKTVSLAEVIGGIRDGKWRDAVELARCEYQSHGKTQLYAKLKMTLPCFTPAGTFAHRSTTGLIQAAGIVQGEFDGLNTRQIDWSLNALKNDCHIVYAFRSPSDAGVKYGFRIPIVSTDAEYRRYFYAACHYARRYFGFLPDVQNEPISQPCYVSYDSDAHFRPDAELFTEMREKTPKATNPAQKAVPLASATAVKHTVPLPDPLPFADDGKAKYRLLWSIQTISAAPPHQRHTPRLKVGRFLGGWIQGGLLPHNSIETVVEVARRHSDEPDQAEHDIRQAVEHGRLTPITRLGEQLRNNAQRQKPQILAKAFGRHRLTRKVTR